MTLGRIHRSSALQPASPPAHPALAAQAKTAAASRAQAPRFGSAVQNLMMVGGAKTQTIFQNITEKFIWSFLGLDVVGMWIPRIKVSLERGRIPYDVNEDPAMKGQPLQAQLKKSITENVKGLNWINFMEEAGREFATGPGVLIIPSVTYSVARRRYGKGATLLGYGPLKQMSADFATHLQKLPADHALNRTVTQAADQAAFQTALRKELKRFLAAQIDLSGLTQKEANIQPFLTRIRQDQHAKTLTHLPRRDTPTYSLKQYLNDWYERWLAQALPATEAQGSHAVQKAADAARHEAMEHLQAELKQVLIEHVNQDIQLGKQAMRLADTSQVKLRSGEKLFGAFLEDTHRWVDMMKTVTAERFGGKTGTLSEIVAGVYQKVVAKKGVLSVLTTLVTGFYLVELAKLIQSHDAYPGERLSHLDQQKQSSSPSQPIPSHAAAPATGRMA